LSGGSASNLRHLDRMGQTAAEVVGGAAGKYLRLPGKAAKRARLHNPLPVTLERCSGRSKRRRIHAGQKRIIRPHGDRAEMQISWHGLASSVTRRAARYFPGAAVTVVSF